MNERTKHTTLGMALAAVTLAALAAIAPAKAYFTTYVTARGGHTLHLGEETTIREDVRDMTKHIVIVSTPDSEPCFVRVKVFAGNEVAEKLQFIDESGLWKLGEDGYYYYSDILPAGQSTAELQIKITVPESATDTFNVVVVQEATAVLYHDDGTPYADWSMLLDTKTEYDSLEGAQG